MKIVVTKTMVPIKSEAMSGMRSCVNRPKEGRRGGSKETKYGVVAPFQTNPLYRY